MSKTEDETTVSISWSARREGNEGFVLERYSDGTERLFGPMRANVVPSFISARRTMFELRLRNAGLTKTSTEDLSHDPGEIVDSNGDAHS